MADEKDTMESRISAAMDAIDFPDPPDTVEDEGVEETVETEETTTDEVVDEVDDVQEDDTEPVEEAGDDAEYHAALAAMHRDGLPQVAIEAMSREQVLEHGAKRARVQSDTATAFGRPLGAAGKQVDREAQEPGPAEAPGDPVQAAADDLRPLAEELGLEPDSKAMASLAQVVAKVAEQQTAPLVQEVQGYRAQAAAAEVKQMQTRLGERLPGLKEDAVWESTLPVARALAESGMHANEADEAKRAELLIEAAYRANNPDTPSRQEIERQQRQRRNRRAGQPTARSTKAPPKELTKAQKMAKAVEMAESGKTPDEITREIGSIF